MRIRALSVFEGIVYNSQLVDPSNPCRPRLEIDAVTRPGDVDSGPVLFPVAEYMVMVGDDAVARDCVRRLRADGRIVEHLDVPHISFPTWTTPEDG